MATGNLPPTYVEDARVRSYRALRNTYVLDHAVFYLVSAVLGAKARLNLGFLDASIPARSRALKTLEGGPLPGIWKL